MLVCISMYHYILLCFILLLFLFIERHTKYNSTLENIIRSILILLLSTGKCIVMIFYYFVIARYILFLIFYYVVMLLCCMHYI